jgi:SagB-type dehydrogenase family enzyme
MTEANGGLPKMIRASLTPGVRLTTSDDTHLAFAQADRVSVLSAPDGSASLLAALADGPVPLATLTDGPPSRGTTASVRAALQGMTERGFLRYELQTEQEKLMTAVATSPLARFAFEQYQPGATYQLSRFAYLRRCGESLVVESARCFTRVVVADPMLAALICGLAEPGDESAMAERAAMPEAEIVGAAFAFLAGAGILVAVDDAHGEDSDPLLLQREFHDAVLHAQSRRGLTDRPIGGVYPYAGKIEPTPVLKEPMSPDFISLHRPDLAALSACDPPLSQVMESRRSIREFADRELSAAELGEFLYRVARVRSVRQPTPGVVKSFGTSSRTYPSGGGTYDLEIYLTLHRCGAAPAGFYHYDPLHHGLELITSQPEIVSAFLAQARRSAGLADSPQVAIALASRFTRLSWKYRGIAYATTLKNVGVLYEAMYLAATAMELAPCGLGGGNAALFANATGLDPLIESSVGEFVLGVRRTADASTSASATGGKQ